MPLTREPIIEPKRGTEWIACECGEAIQVKKCKGDNNQHFYASCTECHSRRFISPSLKAKMEAQKIISVL